MISDAELREARRILDEEIPPVFVDTDREWTELDRFSSAAFLEMVRTDRALFSRFDNIVEMPPSIDYVRRLAELLDLHVDMSSNDRIRVVLDRETNRGVTITSYELMGKDRQAIEEHCLRRWTE